MQHISENQNFEGFRKRFAELAKNRESWMELWNLVISNPWFVAQLRRIAFNTLRHFHVPKDRVDDVCQAAIIDIANSMQRTGGLGFDTEKGSLQGFLSTVAVRSCRKAIRQFRTVTPPTGLVRTASQTWFDEERRHDLLAAIDDLTEPAATVARLHIYGLTSNEVAKQMNFSVRSVYRIWKRLSSLSKRNFDPRIAR